MRGEVSNDTTIPPSTLSLSLRLLPLIFPSLYLCLFNLSSLPPSLIFRYLPLPLKLIKSAHIMLWLRLGWAVHDEWTISKLSLQTQIKLYTLFEEPGIRGHEKYTKCSKRECICVCSWGYDNVYCRASVCVCVCVCVFAANLVELYYVWMVQLFHYFNLTGDLL